MKSKNDYFFLFLHLQHIFPYLCPLLENEKSIQNSIIIKNLNYGYIIKSLAEP